MGFAKFITDDVLSVWLGLLNSLLITFLNTLSADYLDGIYHSPLALKISSDYLEA